MSVSMWIVWALLLVAQNFSFTFVSRARNSGSLKRHMFTSIASNGIWFVSQLIVVSTFVNILSGKLGVFKAIGAGVFYTLFTLIGALTAHYFALKNEKGKAAVGASKKYVQITHEEWARVQAFCFPNEFPADMQAPEPEEYQPTDPTPPGMYKVLMQRGDTLFSVRVAREGFGYMVYVRTWSRDVQAGEWSLTNRPVAAYLMAEKALNDAVNLRKSDGYKIVRIEGPNHAD